MALPAHARTERITVEEYLRREREREEKYEFWDGYEVPHQGYIEEDGEWVAMSGAHPTHNLICNNIGAELRQALRSRGCRTYTSDQRVMLLTGRYVYPDVVAACEPSELSEDNPPALVNPTLVVEVTSPSTAKRDRDEKLARYTNLPSLLAYWIVEQDEPRITQFSRREDDVWALQHVRGLDATIREPRLELALALAEIYAQVAFEDDASIS